MFAAIAVALVPSVVPSQMPSRRCVLGCALGALAPAHLVSAFEIGEEIVLDPEYPGTAVVRMNAIRERAR